ncbi:hypothetical protein BH09PAT2_BH09PAT2_05310 [soil metagenome]
MSTDDIYEQSILFEKIKSNKKLAFLDIDLTLTGKSKTQKQIRELLEDHGFGIIFVTSRPYELLLSDATLAKSKSLSRPPSKMGITEDKTYYHIDLSEIESFAGLLDPDALADTTGSRIYLRQSTGEYLRDRDYDVTDLSADEWRSHVLDLLTTIQTSLAHFHLKKIEDISNYERGFANISPPDFRIQVDFKTHKEKLAFRKHISRLTPPIYTLDDSEPDKDIYSLFLFPGQAEFLKGQAVDRIIDVVTKTTQIPRDSLEVLLSGDSFADVNMGINSAKGTQGTFFLPGAARMAKYFSDKKIQSYEDVDISIWKKKLVKKAPGHYELSGREIYISDELFPGLVAGESLLTFLQDIYF